jgi:hypothetical protein
LPGLHRVYDQDTHRTQKRAALEEWEIELLLVVGETSSLAKAIAKEIERRHRRARA